MKIDRRCYVAPRLVRGPVLARITADDVLSSER